MQVCYSKLGIRQAFQKWYRGGREFGECRKWKITEREITEAEAESMKEREWRRPVTQSWGSGEPSKSGIEVEGNAKEEKLEDYRK